MSRKWLWIVVIVILIFISLFVYKNIGSKAIKNSDKPLSVQSIGADPGSFKGTIKVEGISAGTMPFNGLETLFVADTDEVKLCKTTDCGKYYLLVKFKDKPPAKGELIDITGHITKEDSFYFLEAEQIISKGQFRF